ncbi:hypothetical protein [Methylorubrum aminovorans]
MSNPNPAPFRLVVGRTYPMTGDVTTLAAIVNQSPKHLETRLGYAEGRLKDGYSVLFLVQNVAIEDFIWGDQTRFSGRWQFRRDIDEYVQRVDLLRSELGKKLSYDEAKVDAELRDFLGKQRDKLNVRDGIGRIVKIFPNIQNDKSKVWWQQYPNSKIGNTPQWTISRVKDMICAANVLPGAIYQAST